jgi:penicillin-binding protein 2
VQVIGSERRRAFEGDASTVEDHSWFVGFASRDNPELAVVVFVEHGGKGAVAAAPIAKEIFGTYFGRRKGPVMITEAVRLPR